MEWRVLAVVPLHARIKEPTRAILCVFAQQIDLMVAQYGGCAT